MFSTSSCIAKEFLIHDLMFRLIVNENGVFIYQNLSLGVNNQKQTKFRKLKVSLLLYSLSNIFHYFLFFVLTHSVYHGRNPLIC